MTPFPHVKQASQEAGGTPGVKKKRKLQLNFKEDFFLGHPVASNVRIRRHGEIVISALVFKFMSPIVNLISVTYIYTQYVVYLLRSTVLVFLPDVKF